MFEVATLDDEIAMYQLSLKVARRNQKCFTFLSYSTTRTLLLLNTTSTAIHFIARFIGFIIFARLFDNTQSAVVRCVTYLQARVDCH